VRTATLAAATTDARACVCSIASRASSRLWHLRHVPTIYYPKHRRAVQPELSNYSILPTASNRLCRYRLRTIEPRCCVQHRSIRALRLNIYTDLHCWRFYYSGSVCWAEDAVRPADDGAIGINTQPTVGAYQFGQAARVAHFCQYSSHPPEQYRPQCWQGPFPPSRFPQSNFAQNKKTKLHAAAAV